MKVKLHSRIKIPVEFSPEGVVKPGSKFDVADEARANELVELGYAEPIGSQEQTAKTQPARTSRRRAG